MVNKDDYSAWGYWKAETNSTDLAHFGFWVGSFGPTDTNIAALKTATKAYNYTGNVMESMVPTWAVAESTL